MPNNFPTVDKISKIVCSDVNDGQKPCLSCQKKSQSLHSLFISYLSSLEEGFPKETSCLPNCQGFYPILTVEQMVRNQAIKDCKSYHIKVVAEKDKEIARLREEIELRDKRYFK